MAIGAVTELSPHVDGADGRDCHDAMVGGGGGDHVATGGADVQCANAIRCNLVAHTKEGDGCLNILDPVGGILEPSRLAFAFALICRVESKGDEAPLGQPPRVHTSGLLLDATAGRADDNSWEGRARIGVGCVEVTCELQTGALEGDVCFNTLVLVHSSTPEQHNRCQTLRVWK
ncbi:MAG TPA: hypothetical protein VNO32_40205 [Candidatus Acidoferrum sp.]|nr:hypothetical protein [Candidatus Acidoferrum sp.]